MNLLESYRQHLLVLQDIGRYRKLFIQPAETSNFYINFSTNDYLNLSRHPEILKAGIAAGQSYGVGSTGSRLLSGNNKISEDLEREIARDKQTESALIFNSGFQTNLSVLAALLNKKVLNDIPLVFFDKLNHASLYQAILLSGAQLIRYNHNDLNHLAELLSKYRDFVQPKFIVTETLFGMNGNFLPIQDIADLARQHRAFLYLDEAHSTGVVGRNGYGLSTTIDLSKNIYLAMGTFSKALGCSGGYIACKQIVKDYLVNMASGFIYSTASSPLVIGASAKAWQLVRDMDRERTQLAILSSYARERIIDLGFDIDHSTSHIIPIILKTEKIAIEFKNKLLQNHIIVSCIRPPTVPPGSARIRIALNTGHQQNDIDQFLGILKSL